MANVNLAFLNDEIAKLATKQLKLRDSDHLDPGYKIKKNFWFPLESNLSYTNHIVGFIHDGSNWGLNLILSDGQKSALPMPAHWKEVRAAENAPPVKKVVVWYNYHQGHSHLNGIQFFAADGVKIVEGGNCYQNKKEIVLED